jgi:hypothetical protein
MSHADTIPIFGAEEALQQIQITEFPITYLGVPLSTKAILKASRRPLVQKIANKLPTWKGPLMPKSGRLVLTKSVLSTMPTYLIMADQLPSWAIEEIDSIRRKFLWAGKDQSVRGKCLVAWTTVCLPTQLGGLGIPDLKLSEWPFARTVCVADQS